MQLTSVFRTRLQVSQPLLPSDVRSPSVVTCVFCHSFERCAFIRMNGKGVGASNERGKAADVESRRTLLLCLRLSV
ncbi:hypothetical protein BJF84_15420 [Rhodococcus sp. CUA-806]|nr:hypothetical protein BJF84_15420 [Rhodococcus sp. CUA-806]